jgi:hypothetical protein
VDGALLTVQYTVRVLTAFRDSQELLVTAYRRRHNNNVKRFLSYYKILTDNVIQRSAVGSDSTNSTVTVRLNSIVNSGYCAIERVFDGEDDILF